MCLRVYERLKPRALLSLTTLFKCNPMLTLDLPRRNMSLPSPWHHSSSPPPLDKSVMFHQPPAGPKHTSAHRGSCGGVTQWDAIAERFTKAEEGSRRRNHKQALEAVAWGRCRFGVLGGEEGTGGERSAMRKRGGVEKHGLEREVPHYRVVGLRNVRRVACRPTQKPYLTQPSSCCIIEKPQRNILRRQICWKDQHAGVHSWVFN